MAFLKRIVIHLLQTNLDRTRNLTYEKLQVPIEMLLLFLLLPQSNTVLTRFNITYTSAVTEIDYTSEFESTKDTP